MNKEQFSSTLRVKNSFSIENILSRPDNNSIEDRSLKKQNCFQNNNVLVRRNSINLTHSIDSEKKLIVLSDSDTNNEITNDKMDNKINREYEIEFNNEVASDDGTSSVHTSNSDDRKKRPRTAFSAAQIKALETEFEKGKYLSVSKRSHLSKSLNLTETQIKIWFQNRRTKFKRKYTSDVEILASHYYSSLGISGRLARPMVVGDRLWLFSQPTHGPPAPIQSLLLNNVPPAPQHISSLHPSVLARTYSSSTVPPMVTRQNQEYSSAPTVSSLRNKHLEYFSKLQYSPYSRATSEVFDFRFGNKTLFNASSEITENSSDLASLESRFGNNSSILGDNSKLQDAINVNEDELPSDSEIDCEEVDNDV